jgi:hypothetical protein
MRIITKLQLTLIDGLEIILDSLDSRYLAIFYDNTVLDQNDLTLVDLRDFLMTRLIKTLQIQGIPYEGPNWDPEEVTITIDTESLVSTIANDTEVALDDRRTTR